MARARGAVLPPLRCSIGTKTSERTLSYTFPPAHSLPRSAPRGQNTGRQPSCGGETWRQSRAAPACTAAFHWQCSDGPGPWGSHGPGGQQVWPRGLPGLPDLTGRALPPRSASRSTRQGATLLVGCLPLDRLRWVGATGPSGPHGPGVPLGGLDTHTPRRRGAARACPISGPLHASHTAHGACSGQPGWGLAGCSRAERCHDGVTMRPL